MGRLLAPAAALYRLGVEVRAAAYSWGLLPIRQLKHPVVCVGNLTTGGSGKTPLVAAICHILLRRGFRPGILTRGYARERGSKLIALPRAVSRKANPRIVGDEPALLARALPDVPIVICADRYRGGQFAEERLRVNVHVMDDGFQHLALRRDLDILVVDASQPFFDDKLLPAGRLREPLSALRRAHMVILTRAADDTTLLQSRLRAIHPDLEIFQSYTELQEIFEAPRGDVLSAEAWKGRQVAAFCGIGNPQAFFQDLEKWGLKLMATRKFPDHHRYKEHDVEHLKQLARRASASALVTTEKDWMNLPGDAGAELPLWVCRIKAQFCEPERFEKALLRLLARSRAPTLETRA